MKPSLTHPVLQTYFAKSTFPSQFLTAVNCLLLTTFCLLATQVYGQERRFNAGIIAGVTASQIDGDASAGYNKLGLQAGLRGITKLGKRTDGSIEILYTQRGAKNRFVKDRFDFPNYSIRLDYIEVPVQWHFKDWRVEGEDGEPDWYKASFNIGLVYARYMGKGKSDEEYGLDVVALDYLRKNDLSFTVGANIMTSPHFGFTFRYLRSIFSMYDPRDYNPAPYQNSLVSHSLNFQMFYLF